MSKSAIQTDVQEDANPVANGGSTEATKTQRELDMEMIEARHHGGLAKENGYELTDTPAPAPEVVTPPAVTTGTEDQLAQQLAETPAPATTTTTTAPANPATVKVKVDGEEAEVPMDEVLRQYQKNSSADKRLAEATRLLREAQEREAQLLLQERALEQQRQQAAQAQAIAAEQQQQEQQQASAPSVAETGKQFLKALFEGDEENALAALEKVIAGRQPVAQTAPQQQPTLDINQITNAVTQQVQARVAITSVLEANKRDYPEMYADPDIEELAAQKIARLRNEQGVDFATALNSVSQDFAQKFGWETARASQGRSEPAATPTATARTAKIAQKQNIDNVTSITTKTLTPDSQPEDASSVIAQMKAQRGG